MLNRLAVVAFSIVHAESPSAFGTFVSFSLGDNECLKAVLGYMPQILYQAYLVIISVSLVESSKPHARKGVAGVAEVTGIDMTAVSL